MEINSNATADTPDKGIGQDGNSSSAAKSQGESKFEKAISAMRQGTGIDKQTSEEGKDLPEGQGASDDKQTAEEKPDSKGDTPDANWEKRYKDLQAQKDRETSEAMKVAETIALERVEQDPEYIHKLAETNRPLADRIVKASLGESHGISTYAQLVEAVNKAKMPEETRNILEKEVEPLKKTVEELQSKLSEKEKAEAEAYLTDFRTKNPEFKGEVEKETWAFFEKSGLPLEEAFNYVKYKNGIKEDVNRVEERAIRNMNAKKVAGNLPSTGAPKGGTAKKPLTSEALQFLEGIGAKKTLEKHGY